MALVFMEGQPTSFTFQDNQGNIATTSLFYDAEDTNLISTVVTGLGPVRDALVALSTAKLNKATWSMVLNEDDDELPPLQVSDVRRKLIIEFGTTSPRQMVRMEIPSPDTIIEDPNTNVVRLDNPLVAALVTAVVGTAGSGDYVNSGGFVIDRAIRAWIDVRQRPGALK